MTYWDIEMEQGHYYVYFIALDFSENDSEKKKALGKH